MESCFPSDQFSASAYRANSADLESFSDEELVNHYNSYGKKENRVSTSISSKRDFLSLLQGKKNLLEIGVFDNPTLDFIADSEESVVIHYADFLSRDELITRASDVGRNPQNVPEIKWILSDGYDQIDILYDAVVSHHCVEHQPDLIAHLLKITSILSPGGWYLFSVPHKYRCFDFFISESTIVDVIAAHYLKYEKPSFKSILEHRVFTSHTYHDGVNPFDSLQPSMRKRIESAFDEFSSNEYVDVHCWQFTPESMRKILSQLAAFDFIPKINELKVYPNFDEFYVAISFE